MKEVLAFTLGALHPSSRLRIEAFADAFARRGWRLRLHHFDPGMGKALPQTAPWTKRAAYRWNRFHESRRFAAVLRALPADQPIIVSRELPVRREPLLEAPNPLILDMDDALYLGPGRGRLEELCRRARAVVCGSAVIASDLAGACERRVVIPTVVDPKQYRLRTSHSFAGPLRAGWLGSSMSVEETLRPLMPVLGEIRAHLAFELVVISDDRPVFLRGVSWARFVKWSPEVERAIADHMDVGVMPLQDTPYQRAKCGAKLVQYMAAGLPVIATPVGVNRELVVDGVTGHWAAAAEDWRGALEDLRSEQRREAMGRAGHERVLREYSLERWADAWIAVLNGAAGDSIKARS